MTTTITANNTQQNEQPLDGRARICKDREGKWALHYYVAMNAGGYRGARRDDPVELANLARERGATFIVFGHGLDDSDYLHVTSLAYKSMLETLSAAK